VGLIDEWIHFVYEEHHAQQIMSETGRGINLMGGAGANILGRIGNATHNFWHHDDHGEEFGNGGANEQSTRSGVFRSWMPNKKKYERGSTVVDDDYGINKDAPPPTGDFSKALDGISDSTGAMMKGAGAAATKSKNRTMMSTESTRASTIYDGHASLAKIRSYPKADLTEEAEFAFEILSYALDVFGGDHQVERTRLWSYEQQRTHRKELVLHLAPSPFLLQTIFLIEDDEVREMVLQMPIVRLAHLCPETTGQWILDMLRKRGLPATRAVDYFANLSSIQVSDFSGTFRTAVDEDKAAFVEQRTGVLREWEHQSAIIPSLFVLEEKEIERAAGTSVIWHMLNEGLARPFVIGVVLMDLVLHITLMLSFRAKVMPSQNTEVVPTAVVQATTIFFLVRKGIEGLALLKIGRRVFQSYLKDVWNIFDILAIVFTVIANRVDEPNFNALVLIMLWMKVLSFLKAINLEMATFILALVQILIDIRSFAFVLLVIIMMFGDAMHVIFTSTDNGAFCEVEEGEELDDNVADFCTSSGTSFLRMYGLLLGDFELGEYRQNVIVTGMFIVYTIFGVIMLLNVLIAVVSDSYAKSTMIGKDLFGRARVQFLSEQLTLESFLEPGANPLGDMSSDVSIWKKCCLFLYRMLRWAILFVLLGSAFFAEIYLVGRSIEIVMSSDVFALTPIFMVFLAIVLTFALWIVIDFLLRSVTRRWAQRRPRVRRFYEANDRFTNRCIRFIRDLLFGRGDRDGEEDEEEEWTGRVNYLESKLSGMLQKQERSILNAIHNSEENIKDSEVEMFAQQANVAAATNARQEDGGGGGDALPLRGTRSFQRKTSYRRGR